MNTRKNHFSPALYLSLLVPALALFACGESAPEPGMLEIAVYGEEFIEEGIPADVLVDSWAIDFDSFKVTIQDASANAGHGMSALNQTSSEIFDLTTASEGKGQLVVSGEVPGGDYDHIAYRVNSIQIVGSATRDAVTKIFAWDITTPTRYSECEGTAVVDGGTARTQITIHADHIFYDDLVSGEPNVAFDLIAAADDQGDGDGEITQAELVAVNISGEARYQVGNATDVTDLWSFIGRQSSTVGHIDGEGHCGVATRE